MPIMRVVPESSIQTPQLETVSMPGGVNPVYHDPSDMGLGASSVFWSSLAKAGGTVGNKIVEQKKAEAYMQGEADSLQGKELQTKGVFAQTAYEFGYNKVNLATKLAKLQFDSQVMAKQYADSGKDNITFQQDLGAKLSSAIKEVTDSGMHVDTADSQAWLQGASSTRATASEVYMQHAEKRLKEVTLQSKAKEGNAAITQILAASTLTGNAKPEGMLAGATTYVNGIEADPTLTIPEQEGLKAAFYSSVFSNMKTPEDVQWALKAYSNMPQFQNLDLEHQTAIARQAQAQYDSLAKEQSGPLYMSMYNLKNMKSVAELDSKMPRNSFFDNLNSATAKGIITNPQQFSFMEEYDKFRDNLIKQENINTVMTNGTVLDIQRVTGKSNDEVNAKLKERYGAIGIADGAVAQITDGLKMHDGYRIQNGAAMLAEATHSITTMDMKQLQYKDGFPVVREDIAHSIKMLKQVWDDPQYASSREVIFKDIPEAVKYGIRQNVDERTMLHVILDKQRDINEHVGQRVPEGPVPENLLFTPEDLDRGPLDWSWRPNQASKIKAAFSNVTMVYTSEDERKILAQKAGVLNTELQYRYNLAVQTGNTASDKAETIRNIKNNMVADSIRVDDGTEAGTLVFLPDLGSRKGELLGSSDNTTITEALSPRFTQIRKDNPQAKTIAMDYDPVDGGFRVRLYNDQGVAITGHVPNIHPNEIKDNVDIFNDDLIRKETASAPLSALVVPNVGIVQNFVTKNDYGVPPSSMVDIAQWIVQDGFEGYNNKMGYSILPSQHGYEYAKRPEEGVDEATAKLSRYINDKVLPGIVPALSKYPALPAVLKRNLLVTEAESSYMAGNANAYDKYVQRVYSGENPATVIQDFKNSGELFITGAGSKRNAYRIRMLQDIANVVNSK